MDIYNTEDDHHIYTTGKEEKLIISNDCLENYKHVSFTVHEVSGKLVVNVSTEQDINWCLDPDGYNYIISIG